MTRAERNKIDRAVLANVATCRILNKPSAANRLAGEALLRKNPAVWLDRVGALNVPGYSYVAQHLVEDIRLARAAHEAAEVA